LLTVGGRRVIVVARRELQTYHTKDRIASNPQ